MAAGLEERIGGNLPATAVHQLYEQMQHAPVQPAIRMLERRVTLAFQVLEVDQKDPLIWVCLNAWFEVRKCNSREGASARLMRFRMLATWKGSQDTFIEVSRRVSKVQESL